MENRIKVLVLEDVEEDFGLILHSLKKAGLNFEAQRADTKEEFVEALNTFRADIILSDHALPQFNSSEALRICQNLGITAPFILVTGAVSEEFAVNSLKQGAANYVLKSNLARLPSAITSALKQRETEEAKLKAHLDLQERNEELSKINQELDSFVYSVSHNLKAPLMSVLGLLNLAKMEDEQRGNYFKNYFDMMERSILKLDETLKEILDYSRNARKDLSIEEVDVEKIIQDNLEKMQYLPGSEKIEKDIHIDAESPLYSDAYRLSVIFNNLISNAIKYHDSRKERSFLHITIKVNSSDAYMEFRDNGIGIGKEYLSKVFDMFFRATVQKEGAGLGLYIVKETVEKLKGRIEVESKLGEGTVFRINIPNEQPSEVLVENAPQEATF
jgi:signal transduction histidine kinase